MPNLLEAVLGGLFILPSASGLEQKQFLTPTTPPYQAEANITQRNYEGANLVLANFKDSNASGSNFRHATLDYANLSMADFKETDLTGASLSFALIQFTDFRGAMGLTKEQLAQACLLQARDEDRLGDVVGFNLKDYRLPPGCKIWEQALK